MFSSELLILQWKVVQKVSLNLGDKYGIWQKYELKALNFLQSANVQCESSNKPAYMICDVFSIQNFFVAVN